MTIRFFEVGGSVRDRLLGIPNKDRDFAVEASSWEEMRETIASRSEKVFLEKPEFLTLRVLAKPSEIFENPSLPSKPEALDFVMCRKDGAYSDGRRPDEVIPGTILDDLARRDFTCNAIAVNMTSGEVLDPHNGQQAIFNKELVCVGKAEDRFNEDALRLVRAIRFRVTKDLGWDDEIWECFGSWDSDSWEQARSWSQKLKQVSVERVREELHKCFRHDTLNTLRLFQSIAGPWSKVIFDDMGIWLEPTLKER